MKLHLLALLGTTALLTYSAGADRTTKAPPKYLPLAPVKGKPVKPQAKNQAQAVTFHRDIAPIIERNCASCHSPGQVAPFSLLSYEDVKKRARLIATVTENRLMPPWKADEGSEKFHDARLLSDEQIEAIRRWAQAGAPEGKAPSKPRPVAQAEVKAAQPDVVFEPKEAYQLEAEGADVYRCFVISTGYNEDRWVSSMAVMPQNRKVVHHVIAYLDTSGAARKLDEADAGPGYTSFGGPGFTPRSGTLGGWAPGNEPVPTPPGTGMLLPKGADIVLQVHYHKSGKPETDLTKVGLTFAQGPIDKRMRVMPLLYLPLRIPAGQSNYTARTDLTVPMDVTVHSVTPHMHLLGREMTLHATLPDGSAKKLVRVPDWDFNWQTTYAFKQPVPLPAGSKIELVARYDNSANNPVNPSNPPREVRWGEETTDEMCIAFLRYTVDAEHLTQGKNAHGAPDSMGAATFGNNPGRLLRQVMEMFDEDKDGVLNAQERAAMTAFIRKNA
jgi:mono/diheme cytochrome c family protein